MYRKGRWAILTLPALLLTVACAPASLVDVQPPSGVVDPAVVSTSLGATQLAAYAISNFSLNFAGSVNTCTGTYTLITGALTDELMWSGRSEFDTRGGTSTVGFGGCASSLFANYNQPRVEARQAREALALYAPGTSALQGRMAATEAYTILILAELYCSGIPLSTVTFTGIATPTAGFTTDETFAKAIALFDTAITMSADSNRLVYMAKVGKARALLGQGQLAEAAQAVQGVPTDFLYTLTYTTFPNYNLFGDTPRLAFTRDNEGTNGLAWSTDPRTAIVTTPALSSGMTYSAKYSKTAAGVLDPTLTIDNNPVWLASGVEARLIEAEADLAAGGTNWLSILNALRATCIGAAVCAPVPGLTAALLPPLADPGTADTRLNLLMKERAMWLFLTGHREGDLRRMARIYHRAIESLWPTGVYVFPGFPPLIAASTFNGIAYGTGVVLSPNISDGSGGEGLNNPLYAGCANVDP